MPKSTLYWHDYETFGTDPMRDRPVQFAGIRTDEELNIIGDPLVLYCKPARDVLPQPEACLVTGITPQKALTAGLCEAQFIRRIHRELAAPHTCSVGYNSIRFDDEVTRHTLYRNLFDPYAHEWQHGNSRWDIIDMVRLTRALRPEGIEWPEQDDGAPSFQLDRLTAANDIAHDGAHDALADVYATIALAGLIKRCRPKLYAYLFQNRGKHQVAEILHLGALKPVLHVSGKYAARQGCIALVVPLARHPLNANGAIVYDLSADPDPLLDLSVAEIQKRVFTARAALPQNSERIPLKIVHLNKCPVIVPESVLRAHDAERLAIDRGQCQRHLKKIKKSQNLSAKVRKVFDGNDRPVETDPDLMLYGGGFFSNGDKAAMKWLRSLTPAQLKDAKPAFEDPRLPEMVFRYRARNYPETLDGGEIIRWEAYRRTRLTQSGGGGSIVLEEYWEKLNALRADSESIQAHKAILDELAAYGRGLIR